MDMIHQCRRVADWLNVKLLLLAYTSLPPTPPPPPPSPPHHSPPTGPTAATPPPHSRSDGTPASSSPAPRVSPTAPPWGVGRTARRPVAGRTGPCGRIRRGISGGTLRVRGVCWSS